MIERAHLDSDELADLDEGALDEAAEQAARAHLTGCPDCRDRLTRLGELRRRLAAEDPGPMPAGVATALEAALGAALEAARAAELAQTMAQASTRSTVPALPGRVGRGRVWRGRAVPTWLAAAAAVVVVLGLGAVGIKALGGGPTATGTAAGAARSAAAGTELAPARVVLATGQDYSAATLTAAVPGLLQGENRSSPGQANGPDTGQSAPGQTAPAVPPALTRLDGGPGLAACVAQLAGAPTTALAVDLSSFDGRPAAVVVLATPGSTTTVDVWVVGSGCGQGSDAQVRYFARVPR